MDLVDHGERGARTPAALDHLASCPRCERELTQIALTIAALRRTGRDLEAVPAPRPDPAAVVRLAAAPAASWRWRSHLGGLMAGAALVAVLAAPRIGVLERPMPVDDAAPRTAPALAADWHAAEARLASAPDAPPVAAATGGAVPVRYPDGRLRPWKEVSTTASTAPMREPT